MKNTNLRTRIGRQLKSAAERLRGERESGAGLQDLPGWAVWTAGTAAVAIALVAILQAWAPGWLEGLLGGLGI